MISYRQLIKEQLYYKMRAQNEKAVDLITNVISVIKELVMRNHKNDMSFAKFLVSAFNPKHPQNRDNNLYFLQSELENKNFKVSYVDNIEGSAPENILFPGLYFGKAKLFDEETQSEIMVDVFFSSQLKGGDAYYQEPNNVIICASILDNTISEIHGTIYHELIHATQPVKISPRRYRQSRVITGKGDKVRLDDMHNYIRAGVEFEAQLGGIIRSFKNNFILLYKKSPNNQLWQKTRQIQLDNLKKLTELSRKDVLKEFSINFTEENKMPYPNSIIPTTSLYLLRLFYYASLGEEKTATSNAGRLRWNQLINAFKKLYTELSTDPNYSTK